ncbi:hypothetical protein ACWC4A_54420, partial [Streptomyces mirabilis]
MKSESANVLPGAVIPRFGGTEANGTPGHDLKSHQRWMTAFWHTSRMAGKVLPSTGAEALRYVASKDREFLEGFFGWYCGRFPVTLHLNPKHVKDQTHLTVMAFPKVRDYSTLATLNHAMLLAFYVDDYRHRLDLVRLLDDSRADPVIHEFMEYIRSEIPGAHEGYTDTFREFLA